MTNKRHLYSLLMAATLALSVPATTHAASPRDQNVGYWNYTCRGQQYGTDETITVGADTTWAQRVCASIENDPSGNYVPFPLQEPRPGDIQCGFIFRYGGYWEQLRPPYEGYYGFAQIVGRDDDWSNYGSNDCEALTWQLDDHNARHGYNTADTPLVTIQECAACGRRRRRRRADIVNEGARPAQGQTPTPQAQAPRRALGTYRPTARRASGRLIRPRARL
jgi:hypothetical protein